MDETPLVELVRDAKEVRIVTESSRGERHRTIIWVVVDSVGRILVRSYRGAGARWYREALSGRPVELEVAGARYPVSVAPAADRERIHACSRGFEDKYAGDPATPAMLRNEVLQTTLELELERR